MKEDEEEREINLKRHRQYRSISPRYLIRIFLILTALALLTYLAIDFLETREAIQKQEEGVPTDSTSTEIEIDTLE